MRPILEKIIDPTQSAFVSKCSIHDNILLTHEIMNKFKNMKGKKAWVALKLDMKNTYDRVEWDFLFNTLRILGFHSEWVDLIKACIFTVSYSVMSTTMYADSLHLPEVFSKKTPSPLISSSYAWKF